MTSAIEPRARSCAAKEPRLRDSHRKLLWGLVCGLVAAGLAASVFGCAPPAEYIVVGGGDGWNSGGFSYEIANKVVLATGAVFEFELGSSKDAFFDGLRRSYRVFSETGDRIQLIQNGQIYTIRHYSDGHYALYGDYFVLPSSLGANVIFPFPTDQIQNAALEAESDPIPVLQGTQFTVNCDLAYLQRFYEVYGDAVKVDGNKITYAPITITVGDGGLIQVDVP